MAPAHLVGSHFNTVFPSFEEAVKENNLLVDKSGFVEKVLKNRAPSITTGPRKFGKICVLHLLKLYVEMDYSVDPRANPREARRDSSLLTSNRLNS